MNHREEEYSRYAKFAMTGAPEVDNIVNTQEAYHLEVVKEYRKAIESSLINLSEKLGVPLDLSHLSVHSTGKETNDIEVSYSHKIFADLREETKYKRIQFSEEYYKQSGINIPVEEVTIKRTILTITLQK